MYVDARDHQYNAPLAGQQASQGRERQPSVAIRNIWEALYMAEFCVLLLHHNGNVYRLVFMRSCVRTQLSAFYFFKREKM